MCIVYVNLLKVNYQCRITPEMMNRHVQTSNDRIAHHIHALCFSGAGIIGKISQ